MLVLLCLRRVTWIMVCCLQVDLPSLPRRKLEAERLHYCTAQERTAYSAAVNSQVSLCTEADLQDVMRVRAMFVPFSS